jgi:multicomponent Na+:H+ antiporter subunit F
MGLIIIYAIKGPSVFDRILSANCFTTYVIILICLIGSFKDNKSLADIAIIYALLSFVASFAFLKYFTTQKKDDNSNNS